MLIKELALMFMVLAGLRRAQRLAKLNHEKFIVWGPGLKADFHAPVRYFYVQLVNDFGQNLTYSFGDKIISVEFQTERFEDVSRIRHQILDLKDGSYLVRYRLYDSYRNLIIWLRNSNGELIADSPYYLKGNVLGENCDYPETNLLKWYTSMRCNQTYTQIEADMRRFAGVKFNMDELRNTITEKYNQPLAQSYCNYVVLHNRIYRKCYGKYVGFSKFMDEVLLSLSRKVKLPDVEFFMNLGDYPLNEPGDQLPIVSWCGSKKSNDFVLPTYDLTESTLEMMSRVTLDVFSVQANTGPKWDQKIDKLFWRGRDSRRERLELVAMSKLHPDLVDAALTNMFFYREPEDLQKYGPIVNRTSFFDFFKYKYQMNVDGTVAAYRLPYLLVGDSVILKQHSEFYEHFYADLKPNVHFIGVKPDLSNLLDKLLWAMNNDMQVQNIVKNAQTYSREYLMPHHVLCYHVKFFQAYSSLISSKVANRPGMDEIVDTHRPTTTVKCPCEASSSRDRHGDL